MPHHTTPALKPFQHHQHYGTVTHLHIWQSINAAGLSYEQLGQGNKPSWENEAKRNGDNKVGQKFASLTCLLQSTVLKCSASQ